MIKAKYEARAKLSTTGKFYLDELEIALPMLRAQGVPDKAKLSLAINTGEVIANWEDTIDTLS